jgi:hypothetical protein
MSKAKKLKSVREDAGVIVEIEKRKELDEQLKDLEDQIEQASMQDGGDLTGMAAVFLDSGKIPEKDTKSMDVLHHNKRVIQRAIQLCSERYTQAEQAAAKSLVEILTPEVEALQKKVVGAFAALGKALDEQSILHDQMRKARLREEVRPAHWRERELENIVRQKLPGYMENVNRFWDLNS